MSSLSINVVNEGLRFLIRRLTVRERHMSLTDLNVSVGLKLTICRFVNSSLLLLIINYDSATKWFDGGGLVYDASILMILMAITNPVTYVMDFGGLINKAKVWYYKRQGDKCTLTQQEANAISEGSKIDVADNLSKYFSMIWTCIFFAPIIPAAIPLALFGSLLYYVAFKYMLLRVHR